MKASDGRRSRRFLTAFVCAAIVLGFATAHSQESSGIAPACRSEAHRQFDFWVGEWEVDNRNRQAGGDDPRWYDTGTARDRVSAVLDGCALVEHWSGLLSFGEIAGFSVRAYNPVAERWDLVLLWPLTDAPNFSTFTGSFRHHRGEFFSESMGADEEIILSRFTFADIGPDWLRFDVATSADSGVTWRSGWIMEFTRLGRVPSPVPVDTVRRCTFPRIFELDFLLGWWRGTARMADGRELPISAHTELIAQGCGTLELTDIGDGEWQSLAVQTYELAPRTWVSYHIDTQRPVLVRMDGSARGASAQLEGTRVYLDGEALIRRRWEYGTDGSLRTVLSESSDGGTMWTDLYSAHLTKISEVPGREE